jgi:hypothetical protein
MTRGALDMRALLREARGVLRLGLRHCGLGLRGNQPLEP